jgi:4-amino-4-deoxy-L-arabinose transferase-like glycosyltransferase
MMMLSLLALWLVVLAIQRGQARYLYLAAVVMGLDFNVKLFEALVPLPAIALLYLLGSHERVRRRVGHLAAAAALFVAVSLSWAAAVSLSPAHARPYPIGSTDGSVWNVIFVYNGLDRLSPPAGSVAVHSHRLHSGLFTGTPAAHLAPELVAAVLLGALALVACARLRGAARLRRAAVAAVALWLVTGIALFQHMTNLRVRYLEAFTPAVAAALGIGVALLALRSARGRIAAAAALAAGLVASPLALHSLTTPPASGPGPLAIAAGAAAAALALAAASLARLRPGSARVAPHAVLPVAALALVSLLAGPASSSAKAVRAHQSDAGVGSPLRAAQELPLERWLHAHRAGAQFEAAAAAPAKAAALIAHDGRPVLVLTSYRGRPAITAQAVRADVLAGRVRWFVMDHRCTPSTPAGCAAPVLWVEHNGVDVTRQAGIPGRGVLFEVTPATIRASASARGRTTTPPRPRRSAQSARRRRASHPATRGRRRRS